MSKQVIKAALEAMCCMRDMVAHPDNLAFIDKHISVLQAALAEPEQEPVGWQWLDTANYRKKVPANAIREHWRPLFTAPAPRRPLTDEKIIEHFEAEVDTGLLNSFADGVRFAERAHGIGEQHGS